ncbi:UNKNOWN [Stylonychia lemnae]|uniref:Uncharacterized protein n=1 Tax=Stylonychia lemnae TaxID=5949 RepID=A0A077ZYC9_STYLE|nr:UNKNOWN [Stylonychia lemnae]|eukprot:CDW74855.1 UNKNOWN [Stylonychia lemnae]
MLVSNYYDALQKQLDQKLAAEITRKFVLELLQGDTVNLKKSVVQTVLIGLSNSLERALQYSEYFWQLQCNLQIILFLIKNFPAYTLGSSHAADKEQNISNKNNINLLL